MRFCNRTQPSYTKHFACRLNGKTGSSEIIVSKTTSNIVHKYFPADEWLNIAYSGKYNKQ